jgi:hypothetical protein
LANELRRPFGACRVLQINFNSAEFVARGIHRQREDFSLSRQRPVLGSHCIDANALNAMMPSHEARPVCGLASTFGDSSESAMAHLFRGVRGII